MRKALLLVAAIGLAAPWAARSAAPGCAWPMFGHDPGHSFAQAAECASIDGASVSRLHPAWIVPTRDNITASPTIVDGILYVGSWDGTFYAVDASTGMILWTFSITDQHRVAFGRIVSTAAVDTIDVPGVGPVDVVLFGGGGTLYALAPGRTGPTLLASFDVDPRDAALRDAHAASGRTPQIEIESSPVIGHFADGDRIFVGMDVHNASGVGRTGIVAFALRANDGDVEPYRLEFLYKFDPETALVRHSPTEGSGQGFGCGGVWSSPVLDQAALGGDGILAFGTSNCDNPDESFAAGEIGREAVIAINARTGEQVWRFQPREPNDLDDDFGASPNLLPGGLVGAAGKDGWYYARHLVTGEAAWSTHAGQSGRVQEGFSVGGFLGTPAVGEATIAGRRSDAIFATTALPTPLKHGYDAGGNPLDESLVEEPARLFSLHALDAATGEVLWRTPLSQPAYGHVTYANGLVFVPVTFGFHVQAFDASTGIPLWLAPTLGAPSSAPVIVGDTVFVGAGTRETDADFKAFGTRLQELLSGPLGEHPLSRLSGIYAFKI